ncbi:hypothetical protein RF11_02827 [Thelohanellus kitauei]|uniref:Retropepsins domain-containing protein n=1 Tax=Thelohanellus kitauei TaxID=669202 RepID=A0A0C2N578_THEKT|nr:hypothetical protein RF11_02827 [Thelohanellus kitauei]
MALKHGRIINTLVDTGVRVSLIRPSFMPLSLVLKSTGRLVSAFNTEVSQVGSTILNFRLYDKPFSWEFCIVKELLFDVILGRDFHIAHSAKVNLLSDKVL